MREHRKKRILYLSHVPWQWIKQRPQFIAEGLSRYFEVDFCYLIAYRKKNLVKIQEENNKLELIPLFRLPNKIKLISNLVNNMLIKYQIKLLTKVRKYDYIWITSPYFWPHIKEFSKKIKVIYDCMDDNIGIKGENSRNYILNLEKDMLLNIDTVIVSSYQLSKVVKNRGFNNKPILINNAISSEFLEKAKKYSSSFINHMNNKNQIKMIYVGTISYWFDFETILKLLYEYQNITLDLYGPVEADIPRHERIKYRGIIPHEQLYNICVKYDILVMPFKINDLILSVDPIKVYEYIAIGKPVIASYYPELDKFKEYIFTYRTYSDLKGIINNIDNYKPDESRFIFLSNNTWENRVKDILRLVFKNYEGEDNEKNPD